MEKSEDGLRGEGEHFVFIYSSVWISKEGTVLPVQTANIALVVGLFHISLYRPSVL